MRDLAASSELQTYFAHKALGMTREYGLRANLDAVERYFTGIIQGKSVRDQGIYRRLLLTDAQGAGLVDSSGQGLRDGWPRWPDSGVREPALSVAQGGSDELLLTMPVHYRDRFSGQLLAWVPTAAIYRHLIGTGGGDVGRAVCVLAETPAAKPVSVLASPAHPRCAGLAHRIPETTTVVPLSTEEGSGFYGIRVPVGGSGFSLVLLISRDRLSGNMSPLGLLALAGGLVLFLLLVTGLLLRSNVRNQVLNAHFEEAARQQRLLEEKNTGLREEIRKRRETEQALLQAREAAEVANVAKSQFLANVSHELRTPMTAIMGMNELLAASGLNGRQRGFSGHIQQAADNLLALLNDVLDFSRLEANKLTLEPRAFDAAALARELEQQYRPRAEAKGLALQLDISRSFPGQLVADRARIRQILDNLLNNAVKFTRRGQVVLGLAYDPAGVLQLRVEDSGIGIAEPRQKDVFEKFTQVDGSYSRASEGVGLGLAIVRDLVHLMDGELELESREGHGSVFRVRLPMVLANEPEPVGSGDAERPQPAIADDALAGYRILLAEDNPANMELLRIILEPLGCTLVPACNGREVLEAVAQGPVDLVLMDCQMPDMDGLEATRQIRQREGDGQRTPIVALTAHAGERDRRSCLDAGMDDFLTKPYRQQALMEILSRWLAPRKDR